MFDPALDQQVPLFSRLLFLVTVAVFVCLGGHRMVMAGLLDTFQTIPPGGGGISRLGGQGICNAGESELSAWHPRRRSRRDGAAAGQLDLGLVGRTLPQLNILSLGFGLNAMLAFAALGLTLGAAAWAFQDQIQPALEVIFDALKTPLRTQWQG